MKSSTFILIFLVSMVLAVMLFYAYTIHNQSQSPAQITCNETGSSEYNNVTGYGNLGVIDNVGVEVKYEVTGDPKVVSIARDFIRLHLPVPVDSNNKPPVDWVNTSISVLKIVIKISNNNSIPVYYETNAFCGTYHWSNNNSSKTMFNWRVSYPITVPKITAYKGAVFPVPIICTLDLAYAKVPSHNTVENNYYFIITKPFQGEIKASTTVCLKPFSNTCKMFEGNIPVTVSNNK